MNQSSSKDTLTGIMDDGRELDTELQLFDFTHYPVPGKTNNIARLFYNNVNGLEINSAIEATVNHTKTKKKI